MCEPQFISSSRTLRRQVSHAARQAICLALLLVVPGGAQDGPMLSPQPIPQSRGQRVDGPFSELDDRDPVEQEKRLRALNAERQKFIVSDTNKLLKLAAELNAAVSSANPDSLTLDQLRKLSEIEKLAHSVKEKMSTSVRGIPSYQPPSPPHLR